jgi:hypothetical protein
MKQPLQIGDRITNVSAPPDDSIVNQHRSWTLVEIRPTY